MEKDVMKPIKIMAVTMCAVAVLFFVLGQILMPNDSPNETNELQHLTLDWELVQEDGERIPVTSDEIGHFPTNQELTFEATLPENLSDGYHLAIKLSRQDLKVYIDDELRSEYNRSETSLFSNNGAALIYFIEMKAADSGQKIRFVTTMAYAQSGIFDAIYYGNYSAIWNHYYHESGPEFIMSVDLFILGIITIIAAIIISMVFHAGGSLIYCGIAVVLASIWLMGNSNLRQLVFPSYAIANETNFIMVLLIPLPLLILLNEAQNNRYHKAYHAMMGVCNADVLLCVALNVLGVVEYAKSFTLSAIVCVTSFLLIIITIILDTIRHKVSEYSVLALGVTGTILCGVGQIMLYVVAMSYSNSNYLMIVAILVILLTSIIESVRDIFRAEAKRKTELEISNEKSRLFTRMSHELRTPINAVLGMDSMILRETTDEAIADYAKDIQAAGQHLLSLVNDILDFSKLDSGKLQIIDAEYYLPALIDEVKNLIRPEAKKKGLKFTVSVDANLPQHLLGDDLRIKQVLLNLLSNAVKYTQKGYVHLEITGEKQGDFVNLKFSVKDTGIGIKESDMDVLFADFGRVETEEGVRTTEGTGLGMSITRGLLHLMGSEIKVHSVFGLGSDFSFDLKQKIVDDKTLQIEKEEEQELPTRLENRPSHAIAARSIEQSSYPRILVVDDNEMNVKVFRSFLKDEKLLIDDADSGLKALEMVREQDYALIFMDHMMPGMDGVETFHRLKQIEDSKCPDVPVIALTANDGEGARDYYLQEGFDEFISKPVNYLKLKALVEKFITPREA